ncbi:malate dehydrogenase, cytoplasmic-like [Paramuricea clavata]|uniref:Malate dehydrogenase n=1 Tax=Paramuricea clavata TaxID=317549 RepID=A0A7D9DVT1_PARCT|nr:malate dehydrogenase, cytoplasmic-like [Paramuricea clavata]
MYEVIISSINCSSSSLPLAKIVKFTHHGLQNPKQEIRGKVVAKCTTGSLKRVRTYITSVARSVLFRLSLLQDYAFNKDKMPKDPIKVCITGAAGQIAYSLLYSVAKGDVFGNDQPLILTLLDIQPMLGALGGVCMELQDCAFPLLKEAIPTADGKEAFTNIDVAILVGAFPRKQGMERKDLLQANAKIFESQGKSLDQYAKKSVKILVVGNPANTNCCILKHFAPSIPANNFSCLTRLDQNRACAQIAMRLKTSAQNVRNVTIWGNHSSTQYPDVRHASVTLDGVNYKPVRELINDDNWLHGEFITVRNFVL